MQRIALAAVVTLLLTWLPEAHGGPAPPTGGTGITATIISRGSVVIAGNFDIAQPDTGSALIVAGGDFKISGNASLGGTDPSQHGFIFVHEQAKVTGTADLFGALVVEDGADDHDDATGKMNPGNAWTEYNGGLSSSDFDLKDYNATPDPADMTRTVTVKMVRKIR